MKERHQRNRCLYSVFVVVNQSALSLPKKEINFKYIKIDFLLVCTKRGSLNLFRQCCTSLGPESQSLLYILHLSSGLPEKLKEAGASFSIPSFSSSDPLVPSPFTICLLNKS